MPVLTREQFLKGFVATVVATMLPVDIAFAQSSDPKKLSLEDLKTTSKSMGVDFSDEELKAILNDVNEQLKGAVQLRTEVTNPELAPATVFRITAHGKAPVGQTGVKPVASTSAKLGASHEDIAFASVSQLSTWLHSGKITSTRLTGIYLERLKKYGPKLKCVITLTEERAMHEAARADRELKRGASRGPLHGIPYGVKDLFAAKGYPTTWGADPYKDQVFDHDSAVVERLTAAGGVLLAKLSLGSLAQGDVWFGGRTESPWDPKIGSSGSSAGSACSVAAGLLPYAIGTETSGSIISPSHNCRVTGLRPTFGSVSRYGAMALSWTMDKAGPICRSADDCAMIFASLIGEDERDPSTYERSFNYPVRKSLSNLKVGFAVYSEGDTKKPISTKNRPWLELLHKMGVTLHPVHIPTGPDALGAIIGAESAASFDEFTRTEKIHQLKNSSWPESFRTSRFISAVDLVQADRRRRILMHEYETAIQKFDLIVVDDRGYPIIYNLNLTGHPQLGIPFGTDAKGQPRSFSLIGPAFSEGLLLTIGYQIQQKAGYLGKRPAMSIWE